MLETVADMITWEIDMTISTWHSDTSYMLYGSNIRMKELFYLTTIGHILKVCVLFNLL